MRGVQGVSDVTGRKEAHKRANGRGVGGVVRRGNGGRWRKLEASRACESAKWQWDGNRSDVCLRGLKATEVRTGKGTRRVAERAPLAGRWRPARVREVGPRPTQDRATRDGRLNPVNPAGDTETRQRGGHFNQRYVHHWNEGNVPSEKDEQLLAQVAGRDGRRSPVTPPLERQPSPRECHSSPLAHLKPKCDSHIQC